MADRFPLIVNAVSKKIEEIASGDRLDFSGNGIVINGDNGNGKYLRSDGGVVHWDSPGDVYLTQTQTLTNKTFETCVISGGNNTLTNIPNSALINSGITVNGVTIALGGSVTTPDNNTTYAISAQDGSAATEKVIRLTSGGNSGAGVNDDIKIAVGSPSSIPSGSNGLSLFLDRTDDTIFISGHVVDNNTITTISAPGGSAQSGAISFTSTGAASVSMTGTTVNINAVDTDTKTKIRVGAGGSYGPADNSTGNFTFLASGASTVSQAANGTTGDPEITVSSTDTVTRVRGGSTGTFTPSTLGTSTTDVTFAGGSSGNVTVSQSGNTILIDSVDTNTVTKFAANTETLAAGDFRLKASGDASLSTATVSGVKEITIGFTNTDTGATFAARGGVQKTGIWFQLKNYSNFTGNRVLKWDSGNEQLANSIIQDDGSTVTIDGDLVVQGNQTILNTSTLQVEDNTIELRKGNNLVGFNGGVQVNRTTDSSGNVTAYQTLQWYESGSYWRSWDGSVEKRFVTESETQVLSNKTLTSPTLTAPVLGAATATSINGLAITSTASATLTVATSKTLSVSRSLVLTTDNGTGSTNVNFRLGGDVVYKSDTLASLSSTTSTQLRGLITDTTGLDRLVFQTSPNILTSITTTSTGFALINSGAQSIQFGGAATLIDIGAAGGTTNINQNLVVDEDLTVGTGLSDNLICNATFDSRNADILIRGSATDPMIVGRGGGAVGSNTALGTSVLQANSSGSQNTAVGYQALFANNSGAGNTAYGHQALRSVNVGDGNTAVGRGALLGNLSGDSNVAIGANSMETPTAGNANVCIGYYAGYNCNGSGNVLIGPADSANPVNDVTYSPLNQSGDRQLVIGSGTEFWVRGDNSFNVTLNNNATVNSNLTVKGNLIVNGTTTTVKSTVVEIADKAINLGAVVTTNFTCTTVNGSATITDINPTLGLIPGMGIQSGQGYVPGGTTIVSITGNTAVLSNPVTISGTPTFTAIGPSDTSANDGGIIVNGATNKSFLWKDLTDAWTSSEHMDLATGKEYRIDNVLIASGSQIGPSTGVFTLGASVTTSSLTSVGTLTSLTVSGAINANGGINLGDNDVLNVGAGNDLQIYHDANNSYIKDSGTGYLIILGDSFAVNNAANTENMIVAQQDGPVTLMYNGSTKFATSSTGATLAGTLTVSDNGSTGGGTLLQDTGYLKFGSLNSTGSGFIGYAVRAKTSSEGGTVNQLVSTTSAGLGRAAVVVGSLTGGGSGTFQVWTGPGESGVADGGTLTNFQQRLTVDDSGNVTVNNGNLVIGTSGKGIDFSANANAAGMTSELLDDYEEGTWTPTLVSGGASVSIDASNCTYVKVGQIVTCWFEILGITTPNASGAIFGGLPFSAGNNSEGSFAAMFNGVTFPTGTTMVSGYHSGSSSEFRFYASGTANGWVQLVGNDIGSGDIIGTIVYRAAS